MEEKRDEITITEDDLSFSPFDVVEILNEKNYQAYLDYFVEKGDPRYIQKAAGDISRAIGMSKIAEKSGLSREALYRSLRYNASPTFNTVMKVIAAAGLILKVDPQFSPAMKTTPQLAF